MSKAFYINDDNFETAAAPPGFKTVSEAQEAAGREDSNRFGLVPRNYSDLPYCYSKHSVTLDMPLIPRDEIVERIQEGHAKKQFLSYYRRTKGPNGGHIPALDQNGQGYCWCYSCTTCLMLLRAVQNLPYVRLSAHGPASLIKNYRDEGGWAALCMDHIVQHGVPSTEFWAEKSRARSNDTPQMRENALLHRPSEVWIDLVPPVYNRNLSEDQRLTCLVTNTPVAADRNRWSHSTCDMELVISRQAMKKKSMLKTRLQDLDLDRPADLEAFFAVISTKGLNSWADSYGDLGEFIMEGNSQKMDGGGAIRLTNVSLV